MALRTRIALSSGLLACSLALAGCTTPSASSPAATASSERSAEDAEATFDSVPGVSDVRIGRARDGFTSHLAINVELSDDYSGSDSELVDEVLTQVWSQSEFAPERYVVFRLSGAGRTSSDLSSALDALGIDSLYYGGDVLSLISTDLEARYGSWPQPSTP